MNSTNHFKAMNLPKLHNYGNYSSSNYGAHSLCYTDEKGNKFYFSYDTLIAFETKAGELTIRENIWGTTTGRHLNWINYEHYIRVSSEEFEKKFNQTF